MSFEGIDPFRFGTREVIQANIRLEKLSHNGVGEVALMSRAVRNEDEHVRVRCTSGENCSHGR